MDLLESDCGYTKEDRKRNKAALERCKSRLRKDQANTEHVVKTFYETKEQLAVFLSVDDIKVELVEGVAQVDGLEYVGTFPSGEFGLLRLIERLKERY